MPGARTQSTRVGWGGLLLALLSMAAPGVVLTAGPALAEPVSSLSLQSGEATPSGASVSEDAWARQLVDALGLSQTLPEEPSSEELFSLLCVEKSEVGSGLPPGQGLRVALEAPRRRGPNSPVRAVLSVPTTALYQLSVEGVGLQRWVIDQEPVGHLDPSPMGVAQAQALVPLQAGPHEIVAYLPPNARVDRMELAAYRSFCAAPADGWHAGRPLRHGALARTLVRAFGFERRLPELADERQQIEAESFDEFSGEGGVTERRLAPPASGGAWAAALSGPAEFTWVLELDEPRVVSIEARTHGVLPQIWSVDGRYRVNLEPMHVDAGLVWNHVITLPLASGRHAVRALVARGSGVDVLRVVPRRSSDGDFVRVLEELGLPGHAPEATVGRSEAERTLSSSTFAELAAGFRLGLAGDSADRSLALVDDEPDPLTSRSLSPMLPAEL